jgi:hypothetical protein
VAGDIVTLTVHHREASPAYPVTTITPEERDTAPIQEYDGSMFGQITGPESPERYPLRVDVGEERHLEQSSPTEVEVVYADGLVSYRIKAPKAHDAAGSTVPTSLEVSGGGVVTLTVHHRDGNPAAGGAPFDYPITEGEGWEGGFTTTTVILGPPDEAELRARERTERELREASPPAHPEPPPVPTCKVPTLRGYSLRGAKNRLRVAHCGIGAVHLAAGATLGKGKVVKQFHPAGARLAAGTSVAVKLGVGGR